MTGAEQSDKMGGKTANEVEEGELPEEGEIMDDEVEHQQQQRGKAAATVTTATEEEATTAQHQSQQQSPPFSKAGKEPRRGGGPSSSWRRSFSGRGHSEHNFGGGKQHFPRASGRYRDHDSKATLLQKSEDAMMDSWVRGTHRNKGARSPVSPHRTASGSPCAEQPKQKLQKLDKMAAVVDEEFDQKHLNQMETEAIVKTEHMPQEESTVRGEAQHKQQQPIPPPIEDDKDYRVETPPAKEELPAEESKSSDLIENDDDNDFRRNSFGHFPEKRSFRANVPQLSPQNGTELSLSPLASHRQQQMRTQSMNGPPHDDDDDYYGPTTPKRARPSTMFNEQNLLIGGGGDFRQHQHKFDQSFDQQSSYEQHEGEIPSNHSFKWIRSSATVGGDDPISPPSESTSSAKINVKSIGVAAGAVAWHSITSEAVVEGCIDPIGAEGRVGMAVEAREMGFCRDGDKCTYSHATADSHRQPVLCRYYQQGFCRRNLFCQNLHGEWPCKAFHKGECTKEQCMFSHEPLDDFSRPILEKMLEDERRGLTEGQNLEPQFQGGYYQRRKMFHQMREQHFHHQQQHGDQQYQFSEAGVQNFQSPHQNQPNYCGGGPHEAPLSNDGTSPEFDAMAMHPLTHQRQGVMQHLVAQQAQHQAESIGSNASGLPELPPPALVVPPILGGGVSHPQTLSVGGPPNANVVVTSHPHPMPVTNDTSFGFFNRAAPPGAPPSNQQQMAPPSHFGAPHPPQTLCMLTPPQQPNFQQLQQQAQQPPTGPHFPHQPSLLGPSNSVGHSLNAMLQQQQFGTPARNESFSEGLQQITPTPPRRLSPTREQSDAFNINHMLEQITQHSSEQFKTPKTVEDPMDLLSKAVEESPASPPMLGSCSEFDAGGSADDAKLIPMLREWRLYAVDIPAETEGLPMNFDMKFIQQISSSNSDPRLRKLAEKQFDLVSKTFEKKQQQSAIELAEDKLKKETMTADNTSKGNSTEGITAIKVKKESTATDPRKDPRRKGHATTEQHRHLPCTASSSTSPPPAVGTPSVSVATPFKLNASPSPVSSASVGIFPDSGSAELAGMELADGLMHMPQIGTGTQPHNPKQRLDEATATKIFGRTAEGMGQSADEHFQQPFGGGSFFGVHHQHPSTPFAHQNMQSMDRSGSAMPTQPPPFMAHLHPSLYGHQFHPSSSATAAGGGPFIVPPLGVPMPGGGPPVGPNVGTSLQQQLGAHAFNVGGFSSSDPVNGPQRVPTHQSLQVGSLREKRKNNEYESPLARIASSSSASGGGSARRGARY